MGHIENVNSCKSYLSGFKDVQNSNKVPLGILKILSYALIIPPLVVIGLYLHHKKIVHLDQSYDAMLNNEPSSKSNHIHLIGECRNKSKIDSMNFVSYLIRKSTVLARSNLTDAVKEEQKQNFQKGFHQLSFKAQRQFFIKLINKGALSKFLQQDLLPKDIKEINFTLGNAHYRNSGANVKAAKLFFDFMNSCDHLDKVNLDLKGLGYYNQNVYERLHGYSVDKYCDEHVPTVVSTGQYNNWSGEIYSTYTDRPISKVNAMQVLKNTIQKSKTKHNRFNYRIDFIKLSVEGNENQPTVLMGINARCVTDFLHKSAS